jgi:hypothetical protein
MYNIDRYSSDLLMNTYLGNSRVMLVIMKLLLILREILVYCNEDRRRWQSMSDRLNRIIVQRYQIRVLLGMLSYRNELSVISYLLTTIAQTQHHNQ